MCEPCPAGTFAAQSGNMFSTCEGVCPVGFYCPRGTSVPIECPDKAGGPGLSSKLGCVEVPYVQKENWILLIIVLIVLGILMINFLFNKQTDFISAFTNPKNC